MLHHITPSKDDLNFIDVGPGTTVRVSDPIVPEARNLAAGFTEYTEPSRLEWTFDYDEVFYMIEGELTVHAEGQEPATFKVGDMGYVEKGTPTVITIPKQAYFLHLTQPAWREE